MWSKKASAAAGLLGAGGALWAYNRWSRAQKRSKNCDIRGRQKVLILGAGFAGLTVARELSRLLPEDQHCAITLVDQNNFLLFTPMLTEVAGGELDPRHIVASPKLLSPRINFVQGAIQEIDLAGRSVALQRGPEAHARETLTADHMVIALGSVPKYHHIPGLREHSLGVKSLSEAAAIRSRVLASLERANWEQDDTTRRGLLTFVVGGGGYTGVEAMAAINDLARSSAREYPNIQPEEITSIIVESRDRLLIELSADLAVYARQKLEQRGVQVVLGKGIKRAAEDHVEIEGGRIIPTRTVVWAGGVAPSPLVARLDAQRGHSGGLVVDHQCAVPGHPGVWALGDCAEVPKYGSDGTHAPTAQNATREGELVARNIVATLRGTPPQPFTYRQIASLALVGRHSGVAEIYGHHFSGFLAWALWRAVYLSKMPGMAQRSRIAIDWILDAIYGRNRAAYPVDRRVLAPTHTEPVA